MYENPHVVLKNQITTNFLEWDNSKSNVFIICIPQLFPFYPSRRPEVIS